MKIEDERIDTLALSYRPYNCPLKEMLEYIKPDKKRPSETDVAYVAGWNACLDEIGGEDE